MREIDTKFAAIMIFVCALVGTAIQYYFGLYWLTATLLVMIVVMINGLIVFNEDLDKGGFDYQKGITDTSEARARQRLANQVQIGVIVLLVVAAVWSYNSQS